MGSPTVKRGQEKAEAFFCPPAIAPQQACTRLLRGVLRGIAAGFLLPLLAAGAASAQEDDTVVEVPAAGEPAAAEAPAAPSPQPERAEPLWLQPETDAPEPEGVTLRRPEPPRAKANRENDAHVVSQTRLFSVSGGDALRMGAIATRADEIYNNLCRLLEMDSHWKYAISIRLVGQPGDAPVANPIRTRIAILGGEPNFQIRIYPGGGIDVERLTHAIITMVLYERALRGMNPQAIPESLELPEWLVTGLQQALLWKRGRADRHLYRSLFNRAEMLSPDDIIATREPGKLDAASRQVYEVSCGVLLMCLINQPQGPASLRDLLADAVSVEGSPQEVIGRYFHELGMDESLLYKWWALELAALSTQRATEALSPLETERRLAEALTLVAMDAKTGQPVSINLENAYALTQLPDWQRLVRGNVEQLIQLSQICFPNYRFIINEYCRAIAELTNGTTPDDVQNILGPLAELRRAYVRASIRGRDYLDWYEITHLGKGNEGSFEAYLDTMRLLRRRQEGRPTPISRYLDDIESLHTLAEGEPLPERLSPTRRHAAEKNTPAR